MAANRDNFLIVTAWYEPLKGLPAEDKAAILDAIFEYHITGNLPELSPAASMAFSFMKNTFDENHRKYLDRCERNRQNGAKGGRPTENQDEPKKASGLFGNQDEPKKADNDNDNDSDINIIVGFWNQQNIISHKKITPDLKTAIKKAIKGYSVDEVKEAIRNYSEILKSDYFENYKWTLQQFLNQKNAMPEFLNEGSKWINYTSWKEGGKNNGSKKQLSEFMKDE